MKKLLYAAVIAAMMTHLCSCSPNGSIYHLSGGELLDDAKMAEIKSDLLGEEENSDILSSESTEVGIYEPDTAETVYWTESGSVWHKSAECGYLRKSKGTLSGAVSEAIDAGKEKPCSSCGK